VWVHLGALRLVGLDDVESPQPGAQRGVEEGLSRTLCTAHGIRVERPRDFVRRVCEVVQAREPLAWDLIASILATVARVACTQKVGTHRDALVEHTAVDGGIVGHDGNLQLRVVAPKASRGCHSLAEKAVDLQPAIGKE
jgi:hypothetical protein